MEALYPKAGWVHAGNEGELVTFPQGTRLRFGRDKGHWTETIMSDGNTFCISPEGGVLRAHGDPAPGLPKTLQRWSESILPPWLQKNLFKIADIKPEDLGFSFTPCNNCFEIGCSATIDIYFESTPCEYRITWFFDGGKWGRNARYSILNTNGVEQREIQTIALPNGEKQPIVKAAHFECAKPYIVSGSVPSGNCGHSGAAGCCSCGRHKNDVTARVQKAFDRLCA
jgi:hypothetical protein